MAVEKTNGKPINGKHLNGNSPNGQHINGVKPDSNYDYIMRITLSSISRIDLKKLEEEINERNRLSAERWRNVPSNGVNPDYVSYLAGKAASRINDDKEQRELLARFFDGVTLCRDLNERIHKELTPCLKPEIPAYAWSFRTPNPGREHPNDTAKKEEIVISFVVQEIVQYALCMEEREKAFAPIERKL